MSDGFTRQFAIRLPDGRLFAQCTRSHIFGGAHEPEVVIFDTSDQAQNMLDALALQAAQLGITAWAGTIESRLCSPFSVTDPGEGFAAEVEKWAAQQGGEGQ